MILEDEEKYRDDTVFQMLEKKYFSLQDKDAKAANEFLKDTIINFIIPLMREDELFHLLFQDITYGGSFYKGTRYGKPEEFDLDLVMKLPFSYDYLKIDTFHTKYGFIKIKVDPQAFNTPHWIKYRKELPKWITKGSYLDQNKFRSWMESVVTNALSKLSRCPVDCLKHTHVVHKKSEPAFTLSFDNASKKFCDNANKKICDNENKKIKIDIDLVPVFKFDNVPLGNGYKPIDGKKKTWMAIAKPLSTDILDHNILWRLSFYEPEKEFLEGELKPVIRMLKKFRDKMRWDSIASYYLETLLYNELENHNYQKNDLLRASKTSLFVFALKKLEYAFQNNYLPYFWNAKYNLLANTSEAEMYSYGNRLNRIIRSIDLCIGDKDRLILAETILEPNEIEEFKRDYTEATQTKA